MVPYAKMQIFNAPNASNAVGVAVPLVRELSAEQAEWDAPLPALKEEQWKMWTDSLRELEELQIERPYVPVSLCSTKHR